MLSIILPKNINLTWGDDFIKVVGPLGTIIKKKSNFDLFVCDSHLYIFGLKDSDKSHFYLSIIKNLIAGVSKGFRHKLRLVGVGYKASILNDNLILKIGYSHEVIYPIPTDVKILCAKTKGTVLLIQGKEAFRVNQVASEIYSLRKPDVYKGKGIHKENQILRLKKGKREGK